MIRKRTRALLTELKTQLSSSSPQRRADQREVGDETPRRLRWVIFGSLVVAAPPLAASAGAAAFASVSASVSAAVAAAGTGAATVASAVGTAAGAVAGAGASAAAAVGAAGVAAAAGAGAGAGAGATAAGIATSTVSGDARGNGTFEAKDEELATDRLDGYNINEVYEAIDEDRKDSQELKAKESALGKCVADFAVFCCEHIHSVLSGGLATDEFRFLLDILRGTGSHGVPVTTLLDEEEIIHSRVSTLLERLQRSTSNQEALTITEQILGELHESPNDEEIERRIRNFIETKFAEA